VQFFVRGIPVIESDYQSIVTAFAEAAAYWRDPDFEDRATSVRATLRCRNSFTRQALEHAVATTVARITTDTLNSWVSGRRSEHRKTVAVLNAGNIPMVGLQDLLAVTCSGNNYRGVVSSKSPHLLPSFVGTVTKCYPGLRASFSDVHSALQNSDALIATGSDATVARIGSIARTNGIDATRILLRGARFSVAVLDGRETSDELRGLAIDALLHEGHGCLNATIFFAPSGLDWSPVLDALSLFRADFPPHSSTIDVLKHEERLLKVTGHTYEISAGTLVVEGEPEPRRPGSIVWTNYTRLHEVDTWIADNLDLLQLIVAPSRIRVKSGPIARCVPGKSQDPPLDWKPDQRDTIEFMVGKSGRLA
jgi:hypothetical protein